MEIEATSKTWKAVQLSSSILMGLGALFLLGSGCALLAPGNDVSGATGSFGLGFLMFIIGLVGSIVGKVGGWWRNG